MILRCVPSGETLRIFDFDFTAIGRIFFENSDKRLPGFFGVFGGGNSNRKFQSSFGSKHISGSLARRHSITTGNGHLSFPDLVEVSVNGIGLSRLHIFDERILVGDFIIESFGHFHGLSISLTRNYDLKVGMHLSSLRILDSVQKLTNHAERRRNDARSIA